MTQQETLSEFMNRRMAELGLGYKALTNAGIGGQTQQNIKMGIPFRMAEVTKEKLAKVLQCTIGDINAALAVTTQTTPFGEEITKVSVKKQEIPSVMKTVDKLEQTVEEDYPELFTEQSGTNEEKSEPIPDKTDIKPDKNEPASSKTSIKADDFAWQQEQPKPKRKKIVSKGLTEAEPAADLPIKQALKEYRQQLKDMCLKEFTRFGRTGTMEAAYVAIARELLKDLLGEGVAE